MSVRLNEIVRLYDIKEIADTVISNEKFQKCSGSTSPNKHHYGTGQLLIHTAEVVELCMTNAKIMGLTFGEKRQLALAAIFHDYGKIYDYEEIDLKWVSTNHKYKIHHIFRSASFWEEQAKGVFDKRFIEDVTHAILSHHQLKEWGSPVQPQTKIAWILHLCDSISARVDEL